MIARPPAPAPYPGRDQGGSGGSSFYWAMALLPADQRAGLRAIYRFCRAVDDIADEPGDPTAKAAALDAWRTELAAALAGTPATGLGQELATAAARYDLPRSAFQAILAGMAMDVRGDMVAPSAATLELYCARVAAAPGRLILAVLGARGPAAERLAAALGRACQLVNICRDLGPDAAAGRLYVPHEWLAEAGVPVGSPADAVAEPAMAGCARRLLCEAEGSFAHARGALTSLPALRPVWPAVAMMRLYRRLGQRLTTAVTPWRGDDAPAARLGKPERLAVAAWTLAEARLAPARLARG